MSTIRKTIGTALQAVGSATEQLLLEIVEDFEALHLTEEERLDAVGSAVAAIAWTHYGAVRAVYLAAVRIWALEISESRNPEPPFMDHPAEANRIIEGADVLTIGTNSLIEMMATLSVRAEDRLIAELALVSRLLGRSDANTILRVMGAIESSLQEETFRPGALVHIPLREARKLLDRSALLKDLAVRGCA
jgi:hypothetical protein